MVKIKILVCLPPEQTDRRLAAENLRARAWASGQEMTTLGSLGLPESLLVQLAGPGLPEGAVVQDPGTAAGLDPMAPLPRPLEEPVWRELNKFGLSLVSAGDLVSVAGALDGLCRTLSVPYLRLAVALENFSVAGPLPLRWKDVHSYGILRRPSAGPEVETGQVLFPDLPPALRRLGHGVLLLHQGDRVLGLLAACLPLGWSGFQETLAATLSAALVRMGDLVTAVEAERRRLGQELHDDVCQKLAALSLYAASLGKKVKDAVGEDLPDLAVLSRLAQDTANQVRDLARNLARGLAPPGVSPHPLGKLMESFLGQTQGQTGLRCHWDSGPETGPTGLSPEGDLHLFRILQEAVKNTLTHAGAKNIYVRLQRNDGTLVLEYEDDGSGFSLGAAEGLGLRSIRYRASLIGASVSWAPGSGGGFFLRLVRPEFS